MRFNQNTIVPSEFRYHDSYDMGGSSPLEVPFNIGACETFILQKPVDNFEHMDKCCICGTHFRYGEAWEHTPTGERMSIGHICASKYGLMADDAEYQGLRAKAIRKAKREIERKAKLADVIWFLNQHHETRVHLSLDNDIVRDMKAKLEQWGSLTEKQLDFLKRLYDEAQVEQKELPPVPMPEFEKRATIEGEILGVKWVEGYGYHAADIAKMIVRVEHGDGAYKVYGTMPDSVSWELNNLIEGNEGLRGLIRRIHPRVRFTAAFEVSRDDKTFGFFKRPTKAELLMEVAA